MNDGLTAVFSIVAGVAGASSHNDFIVVAGLAGVLSSALSTGASACLANETKRELFEAELAKERQEMEENPEEEEMGIIVSLVISILAHLAVGGIQEPRDAAQLVEERSEDDGRGADRSGRSPRRGEGAVYRLAGGTSAPLSIGQDLVAVPADHQLHRAVAVGPEKGGPFQHLQGPFCWMAVSIARPHR